MKLVREHIYEKFTEDSDPIHDMGIGKLEVGDTVKLKDGLDVGKRYGGFLLLNPIIFSGEEKITRISPKGNFVIDEKWLYPKEMLELVKKGSKK